MGIDIFAVHKVHLSFLCLYFYQKPCPGSSPLGVAAPLFIVERLPKTDSDSKDQRPISLREKQDEAHTGLDFSMKQLLPKPLKNRLGPIICETPV
jgi:hypothetical protein